MSKHILIRFIMYEHWITMRKITKNNIPFHAFNIYKQGYSTHREQQYGEWYVLLTLLALLGHIG